MDFIARRIIEDSTEMVAQNIDDIDASEFVTPIVNDQSFAEWMSGWGTNAL